MKKRTVILLDLFTWGFVIGFMLLQADPSNLAKLHWHSARACRGFATWFGQQAIRAELRYMTEVQR